MHNLLTCHLNFWSVYVAAQFQTLTGLQTIQPDYKLVIQF